MTPTRYGELCAMLERSEEIKANFKKIFTEKFSDYMGCPDYCVTININESAITIDPLTYKARLEFKVETDLCHRVICVSEISFIHYPDKAPNYQDQASFKGLNVNLAQDASPMFRAILEELTRTLALEH